MTNNNWYKKSQTYDELLKEAGLQDSWRSLTLALALLLAGGTVQQVSQRFNIPEEKLQQAMQNPELVEEAKQHVSKINQPETQETQEEYTPDPDVTPLNFDEIKEMIFFDETSGGFTVQVNGKNHDIRTVYLDPENIPTIGVGNNLRENHSKSSMAELGLDHSEVLAGRQSLTEEQVLYLFEKDVGQAIQIARSKVSNFDSLPSPVKNVVVGMTFNLGGPRFSGFEKMIDALEKRDFERAANEMVDSKWYSQVGNRSKRYVNIVRNFQKATQNTK